MSQQIGVLRDVDAQPLSLIGELYISVKAVAFHLRNAFRKLNVRSRRDLPEALGSTPG